MSEVQVGKKRAAAKPPRKLVRQKDHLEALSIDGPAEGADVPRGFTAHGTVTPSNSTVTAVVIATREGVDRTFAGEPVSIDCTGTSGSWSFHFDLPDDLTAGPLTLHVCVANSEAASSRSLDLVDVTELEVVIDGNFNGNPKGGKLRDPVTGTVKLRHTGHPYPNSPVFGIQLIPNQGRRVRRSTTDRNGRFTLQLHPTAGDLLLVTAGDLRENRRARGAAAKRYT